MKTVTQSRRSLRKSLLAAWLVPAAISIAISIGAFFALGAFEYQNSVDRLSQELEDKSNAVARRLSAEILLGKNGAIQPVSDRLKHDFGLSEITLDRIAPNCLKQQSVSETSCRVSLTKSYVTWARAIPGVQDPQFVRVSNPIPTYWRSLHFELLIWSTIPVLLLLGLGAWAQKRMLSRHIIQPIEELASQAALQSIPPPHWSEEMANLSCHLQEAFRQRDQVMIGQLASGVIHDIKTLLHSLLSATELVKEVSTDSSKRATRLEALYRAASVNLPKMRSIVESTLDGSRDIPVQLIDADLSQTVRAAIDLSSDYALKRQVALELLGTENPIFFAHDPVQLERALSNLIRNGIEAFDPSFSPDKRVRVQIESHHSKGVSIRIDDSGPGLEVEGKALLTSVRTTKAHGTGLGLLVTRKIVEAHRGALKASHSVVLPGASFEVQLPISDSRLS